MRKQSLGKHRDFICVLCEGAAGGLSALASLPWQARTTLSRVRNDEMAMWQKSREVADAER